MPPSFEIRVSSEKSVLRGIVLAWAKFPSRQVICRYKSYCPTISNSEHYAC